MEVEAPVKFIMYMTGVIRTPEGRLVAHYDTITGHLEIDGHVESFRAGSVEEAMDMINIVWVA